MREAKHNRCRKSIDLLLAKATLTSGGQMDTGSGKTQMSDSIIQLGVDPSLMFLVL